MEIKLTLVEIHDLSDDDYERNPELPNRVTVKVEGMSVEHAVASPLFEALDVMNLKASERLAGHLEFLTFAFDTEIRDFFGVPSEEKTAERLAYKAFSRRCYVRTIGELRAATADLPDDFPLVHTTQRFVPNSRLFEQQEIFRFNALGMQVHTGQWCFEGPGRSPHENESWSLRLSGFDIGDWEKVMDGTWTDTKAGVPQKAQG